MPSTQQSPTARTDGAEEGELFVVLAEVEGLKMHACEVHQGFGSFAIRRIAEHLGTHRDFESGLQSVRAETSRDPRQ